jgi:inner membrane protein
MGRQHGDSSANGVTMNRFPLLTKAAAFVLVFLLVNLVLSMIQGLVNERRWRGVQAARSVELSMAGRQTLLGPLMQRNCTETWSEWEEAGTDKGETKPQQRRMVERQRSFVLAAAPQRLQVESKLANQPRYRGIFKINGYTGRLEFDATWPDLNALQPRAEHAGSQLSCEPVRVWVAADDVRGLRSAQARVDGTPLAVQPGTPSAKNPHGLQFALDAVRSNDGSRPLSLQLSLELLGTTRLALVPAAGETRWSLRSDWPHPSFGGRFLPSTRDVTPQGSSAEWLVSTLSSTAATDALGNGIVCRNTAVEGDESADTPPPAAAATGQPCLDTMAVTFMDPVNPYVLSDRATKYAVLFIVLTFGSVALSEFLGRRRVHPVQYTLVGLALSMFFLLLLSLSEHIAFGHAYAVASASCVALLGFYGRFMLGSWRGGAAMGCGVAVLYGTLWTLLQMEQTALIVGSLLLFAVLASVMVVTRRVDWYELFAGLRQPAQVSPEPSFTEPQPTASRV